VPGARLVSAAGHATSKPVETLMVGVKQRAQALGGDVGLVVHR
jgi:hypothetical protein